MSEQKSLKNRFVNGVIWGIIEKFSSLLVGFVITIVLARILTPEDYGLVNMIYIFTVIGTVLQDAGFGQALIQRKKLSESDFSSVFYINVVMGVFIYGILYVCAPFIADFYNQPALTSISRVSFLVIPITSVGVVQFCLLTKELKVKQLTYVSILSLMLSGIISICLVLNEYGIWTLVYQSLSYQFFRTIFLWFFSNWRPSLSFNISFIKSIWNFSMNLLSVFTLVAVFQNVYTILIGKLYNVKDVGYYNQAFRLQSLASSTLTSSIERVFFPALSTLQDNPEALKNIYKRIMLTTMYIYLPIMMCLALVGHNLFLVLFSAKWLPSVPLFYILCIAVSFSPLNTINAGVIKAKGEGKIYKRLMFANYAIMSVFIAITYSFGLKILLIGYAASALIQSLITMFVCGRRISYNLREQIKDLCPVFGVSFICCLAVSITQLIDLKPLISLLFSFIVGIFTYMLVIFLFKTQLIFELKSIINK